MPKKHNIAKITFFPKPHQGNSLTLAENPALVSLAVHRQPLKLRLQNESSHAELALC